MEEEKQVTESKGVEARLRKVCCINNRNLL